MFAVTAILSCVIKIRGLFKSTKWRHFENVKFEALSARRVPKKGLKTRHCSKDMNMDNNVVTPPKRGLKTRPLNMDMNKDIATLPKEDLKTRPYNIDMEKRA